MIDRLSKQTRTEVYVPNDERVRGQHDALEILRQFPTPESLAHEAAIAEQAKHPREASVFNLLAQTPAFIENDMQMAKLKYNTDSHSQHLRERHQIRDRLFLFNEAVKEYLNQHQNESMDYVTSFANTSYLIDARNRQQKPFQGSSDSIMIIARGMRAELAVESILGRFTNCIDFDYDQIDDLETRRRLDARGVDYTFDVTALGEKFTLDIDVKANRKSTQNNFGYTIPGKFWSQCLDSDFVNNSSRLESRAIYEKVEPMRRALIEQITLQHPHVLEELCRTHGIELNDVEID